MRYQKTITLNHPDRLYLGGKWVKPSTDATFDVVDSHSEEIVARVAAAQTTDINNAVAAAREAFDSGPWPRMQPEERAAYLEKIASCCEDLADEFARIWSIESGIVFKIAKARIGVLLSNVFRLYASKVKTFPFVEPCVSSTGNRAFRVQEAVGVVAAIIPWNGPAGLIAYKLAPALLAGCTVIIKSSIEAPCSAYLFAQICEKIGLPPGVVNVVTADRQASELLVSHPDVDKISFTGSTVTGRRIGAAAAARVARVTLELGGKSPAIVLNDYDIRLAAESIARGFFSNLSGQVCHSLTRIIVPRSKHNAMVAALSDIARSMVVGDPFDPSTTTGPLATANQRNNVERYITTGVHEGATLATGGKRPLHLPRGFYIEPTIFADVDNKATIAQEEIFGPVLCVIPAQNEEHAIELANDSIYGLNGAVYTNDPDKAMAIARQLRTGSVGHNASRVDFALGFGGFKQSGIGREGGDEGLAAFLESKTIILDRP